MSNTAPQLAGFVASVTFTENTVNAAPQVIDSDFTFTDPKDNFSSGNADYFDHARTRLSLSKDAPLGRLAQRVGTITGVPRPARSKHNFQKAGRQLESGATT